jgi:hypothetical protein
LPVLPLLLGSLITGLICRRSVKAAASPESTHVSGEPAAPNDKRGVECRGD